MLVTRTGVGVLLLLALAPLALVATAVPARAHAFLASTQPEDGARLDADPDELALQWSEAVVAGSVGITIRNAAGTVVLEPVPRLESRGRVARAALPPLGDGVHSVSWTATSAVDGHEAAGRFGFGVGEVAASAASQSSAPVERSDVAATWLLFGGLSLAAGGAVRPAINDRNATRRQTWVRVGTVVGAAGAGWQLFAVDPGLGSTASVAAAMTLFALLLAMMSSAFSQVLAPAALLAVAVAAWSARGHTAAAAGYAGWALDSVHLAAAAVWVGSLVHAAVELWRDRADRAAVLHCVRSHSRLSAVLVAVVAATGVLQAMLLLPTPAALLATGYGRIITVKSLLVAAALGVAALGRSFALPAQRHGFLQRLTAWEGAGVAAVLLAAALLVNSAPPQAAASASLLGPPPIQGPVARAMGLAGSLTVHVQAGDGRLDIEVISPSGGVEGTQASTVIRYPDGGASELRGQLCGAGCYTHEVTLPAGRTDVEVTAAAPGWTGGTMTAGLDWPPPRPQPQLFDRMFKAMRAARNVWVSESVSSVQAATTTPADEVGPPVSGSQFVARMPWSNGGVTDVRRVPGDTTRFSFYLPGESMLFVVRVDAQWRLREQQVVNPGHVLDYRFRYGGADRASVVP